jgi:hypothetical protein
MKEGGSSQADDIDVSKSGKCKFFQATGESGMKCTAVGVDIAKNVFQLHYMTKPVKL